MRGYATMMPMIGELNEQQKGYVEKIISGVENMARLVAPVMASANNNATGCATLIDTRTGDDVTAKVLAALPADLAANLAASVGVLPPGYDGAGAAGMAKTYGLGFLGAVPLDPAVADAAEKGRLALAAGGSAGARALAGVVDRILDAVKEPHHPNHV